MVDIDLVGAFVVGLLGGVHCVGMCGGIVGALSLGMSSQRRWPLLLAYNLGRVGSYVLAGAVMGALGFYFSGLLPVQSAQRVLQGIAGLFVILLGLYLAGWLNWLAAIERAGGVLWRKIEPFGRGLLPIRTVGHALALGMLWGWLPCGLVYSALVWTVASGGPAQGGLLMLAFGVGTLPNLLLMGAAATSLQRALRRPGVRPVAGVLVMAVGLWQLSRAWQG